MNILIPDSWLKSFLKTIAKPKDIAKYLSLSGPSVEKTTKVGADTIYSLEITTNRVDSSSIMGIVRELSAILPRFNIEASLLPIKVPKGIHFVSSVDYLKPQIDSKLCYRFSAVLIKNVKIGDSPSWMKERLGKVGIRSLNNIVDISNYLMVELGQPMHTFDYDKIKGAKMILRTSKKGEQITTLDKKTHTLKGGDIVIEDASAKLIDLAGIMGGEISAVDKNTKNVLLFVQTYNPVNIRRTSMYLSQRTDAAMRFEKGLDPELVPTALKRGIALFEQITGGKAEKNVLDIYPNPYKPYKIKVDLKFLSKKLGLEIKPNIIAQILNPLGFAVTWQKDVFTVKVPSWRSNDIKIPEDILEEVARIYGYHKLPSILMNGKLPDKLPNAPFDFEFKVKNLLKGWGLVEVYSSSLVPREFTEGNALKLKNPLGNETEYLRTNLRESLISAVNANLGEKEPYGLFEMANVYLPEKKYQLPQEQMILAGIFKDYTYRKAKGIIESLLESLNIKVDFNTEDLNHFKPSHSVIITNGKTTLGKLGYLNTDNLIYFEFPVDNLKASSKILGSYKPIPKYPSQLEDITLFIPVKTKIGEVIKTMMSANKMIADVILKEIYKDAYTFRVIYLNLQKTLTDKDVEIIRNEMLKKIKNKYGAYQKN